MYYKSEHSCSFNGRNFKTKPPDDEWSTPYQLLRQLPEPINAGSRVKITQLC